MDEMVADGLIIFDDKMLKVTEIGQIFLRNIAYLFDGHIIQEKKFSASV